MNASSGSWFVRRCGPLVHGSVIGRAAAASARGAVALVRGGDDPAPRLPRMGFEAVVPSVRDSLLVLLAARVTRTMSHAIAASRTSAFVRQLSAASARVPFEDRIGAAAAVIAVASVTHSFMLLFLEQYHYPRRTALILPILVGGLALLVTIYRTAVARAFADRRHR